MYRTTCKYVISYLFLFIVLVDLLFTKAQGQELAWSADKLSETTQAKLIQFFFQDGLYDASQKSAATYLSAYPNGNYRELVLFIRARSLELRQTLPNTSLLLYQQLTREFPKSKWRAEANLSIGILHFQQQQYTLAKETFIKVLVQDAESQYHDHVLYWFAQASMRQQPPVHEEIFSALHAITKDSSLTDEENRERFYMLVQSSLHLKNFEKAKFYANKFEKLTKDKSRVAQVFFQIATTDYERQEFMSAQQYFERVLKLPHSKWRHESLFLAGESLYSQDQTTQAILKYKSYLATQDNTYQTLAQLRLGEIYQAMQQWKQADSYHLAFLQKADNKEQKNLVHRKLGQSYLATKQYEKSIKHLKIAIKGQYQNDANVIADLSQALEASGNIVEQQAFLKAAKGNQNIHAKDRYAFQFNWAVLAFQKGSCQELTHELKSIPEQAKDEEKIYLIYIRGMCHFEQKNWQLASTDLAKIPITSKFFSNTFDHLLEALRQQNDWKQLESTVTKARRAIEFTLQRKHFLIWVQANIELNQLLRATEVYIIFKSALPEQLTKEDWTNWADLEGNLQNYSKSASLYKQALAGMPSQNLAFRKQTVEKIFQSYVQLNQMMDAAESYQYLLYPFLQGKEKQALAFKIAKIHLDLKNPQAKLWLQKSDLGKVDETSIEAVLLLVRIDESEGKITTAIAKLVKLSKRKLPPKWTIPVSSQLANFQEQQNQLKQALKSYQKIVALPPAKDSVNRQLQTRAKLRERQISNFLGEKQVEQWIQQKEWNVIKSFIQKGFQEKQLTPNLYFYEGLLLAKFHLKDYKGFLYTYRQYDQKKGKKAVKLEISMMYAEALDSQKKIKDASREYRKLLKRLSKKDVERQVWIARRLRDIYEQLKYWKSLTITYNQVYPVLNTKSLKIEFAYLLATLYMDKLKDTPKAASWFQKVDQGGISELEMQAVWNVAEYESPAKAMKRLEQAVNRKKLDTKWKLLFHYQLGVLYQNQEQWKKALAHYQKASQQKSIPQELQPYISESQKQAHAIQNYLKQLEAS